MGSVALRKNTFIVLCTFSVIVFLTVTVLNNSHASTEHTANQRDPNMYVEKMKVCDSKVKVNVSNSLPVIYFITPTYRRPEQIPELTRLGQTLRQVAQLHWIVAEDSWNCYENVQDLIASMGISYTYLASPMPERYRHRKLIPRGVANRRAGLQWIRSNVPSHSQGVIYLGDDDNVVSLKLFNEIRSTNMISMFPVGLIGEFSISSPIVKKGKVVGFYDSWKGGRKYPVDMAGFAISMKLFQQRPNATMPYWAGHEEDQFLQSLGIDLNMIEPKADNCTKVYVWHTKTLKNPRRKLKPHHEKGSNLDELLQYLWRQGVIEKG